MLSLSPGRHQRALAVPRVSTLNVLCGDGCSGPFPAEHTPCTRDAGFAQLMPTTAAPVWPDPWKWHLHWALPSIMAGTDPAGWLSPALAEIGAKTLLDIQSWWAGFWEETAWDRLRVSVCRWVWALQQVINDLTNHMWKNVTDSMKPVALRGS